MKTQQNMYLWLVPNTKDKEAVLHPAQSLSYDFTESLDGTFTYTVWVLSKSKKKIGLRMELNGQVLCEDDKLEPSEEPVWTPFSFIHAAKGEHKLTVRSNEAEDVYLEAILLTRDDDYVSKGYADDHRISILKGEKAEDVIQNSGLIHDAASEAEKKRVQDLLYQKGFLERFDQKCSEGRCRNGVPMGGIGAGKIELDADGMFTGITINNNCDVPIYKTDSSFFAVYCESDAGKAARVLRKKNYGIRLPLVDKIGYHGLFPTAELTYQDAAIPAEVSLTAFSALIPNDVKNSSLPGVVYRFTVKNPTDSKMDTAILFSWENLVNVGGSMVIKNQNPTDPGLEIMNTWNPGFTWSDRTGNTQTAFDGEKSFGLTYHGSDDKGNPSSFGDYTLACLKDGSGVGGSYLSWDALSEADALWSDFAADGVVSSDKSTPAVELERHTAGAVSKKVTLAPGESREIVFVLTWNMPVYLDAERKDMGVYYTNFFKDSRESSDYILANYQELYNKTTVLHRQMLASSLEPWLSEKLINDMFPIYSCSWFTKAGKFAINEAPTGMMGCLGTMDQRLACNVIYTNFFKELDKVELKLFADNQGSDGSIGHDVGFGLFIDGERKGTWSDLCSSFVMQVYKHYLYTGDRAFMDEMYPRIKRAVQFQQDIDLDGNTIPDVGAGHGTTYDTYRWYGTCAFVASLWLCELKICIKLARQYKDDAFAALCKELLEKSQKAMMDELWNDRYDYGGYFNNYNDKLHDKHSDNCFIAQLAGQWFAQLMDLGYILPEDKVKEAISTITKRNLDIKNIAMMSDETTPEGEFNWYGYTFVQYDEAYYGCLAIYNDFVKEGLNSFRKVYEASKGSPWMTALTYFTDGRMGGLPYYMTNPASFFLLEALSGWMPDVVNGVLKIAPHIEGDTLSLPLYSPSLWLWLDYQKSERQASYTFKTTNLPGEIVSFKTFVTELSRDALRVTVNGREVPFSQAGNRLSFRWDFTMDTDAEYQVVISF